MERGLSNKKNHLKEKSNDRTLQKQKLARVVLDAIGGEKPKVLRYWDELRGSFVDVAKFLERPGTNVDSYATLSLSDHPLFHNGKEFPLRLELVGACRNDYDLFPDIVTEAAFCIIKNRWFCAPGLVFPDIVSMYYPGLEMKHVYFTPPYLWEEGLNKVDLGLEKVTWLLLVPISEPERQYALRQGDDALETLFEEEEVDIFDLGRASVL